MIDLSRAIREEAFLRLMLRNCLPGHPFYRLAFGR